MKRVTGRGALARQYKYYRTMTTGPRVSPATFRAPKRNTPAGGMNFRGGGLAKGGALALKYAPIAYRWIKRRKLAKSILPTGAGSTFSSFSIGRKRLPRELYDVFKRNQIFTYSLISTDKLSTTAYGLQASGYQAFNLGAQWNDDLDRATGGSASVATRSISKVYYGTCKATTTFTNQELTTTYLTLYEMVPRFPITSVNYFPIVSWDTGLDEECGTSGVSYSAMPFSSPFKSHRFVDYHKVLKIIRLELAPGESHQHVSTYRINRGFRGTTTSSSLGFVARPGFTHFLMYTAAGQPLNDSTTKTLISTSSITVDIVCRREYDFANDPYYREKGQYENTLGTITAAKVISDSTQQNDILAPA